NGLATTAAGLVAVTLGVAIRLIGGDDLTAGQLAWLLAAGAVLWVLVAAVYATVRGPAGEPRPRAAAEGPGPADGGVAQARRLLRDDKVFRHFVTVRSLLLVSALSPPFVVMLSLQSGAGSLAGLGGFVVAAGLAQLVGGRAFGRAADRSSRRLMSVGAGI